jgi:hypothetical protein
MTKYVYTPTDQSTEYTPDQVIKYLASKGVTATEAWVQRDGPNPDLATWSYVIEADSDPTAALAAAGTPGNTPDPTAYDKAIAYLRQITPVLLDETQTVSQLQMRRALAALIVVVRGERG